MAAADRNRIQLIIQTFVELADTMASDYAIADLLHTLVHRSATLLGADVAGVLLEDPDGGLELAAATSSRMEQIERVEISYGQGPCIEAYRSGSPVLVAALEEERARWPDVVPHLLDLGMRSGHAFPIRLREDRIGALNCYREDQVSFDEQDVALAQAFADIAAIGILQRRTVAEAEERSAQLQHALQSRVVIEQAKGILAQQHGVGPEAAFESLRAHARRNRMRIHDLCRQVVDGTVVVPEG